MDVENVHRISQASAMICWQYGWAYGRIRWRVVWGVSRVAEDFEVTTSFAPSSTRRRSFGDVPMAVIASVVIGSPLAVGGLDTPTDWAVESRSADGGEVHKLNGPFDPPHDHPNSARSTCTPEWHPGFGARGLNNHCYATAVFDDGTGPAVFVGGTFTRAGDVAANAIAKWDGTLWSALGTGSANGVGQGSGVVNAMTVFDDGTGPALYVAGNFTSAGGLGTNSIAKWNGQSWSRLGNGPGISGNITVHALATFDDGSGLALYVAGEFVSAGGQTVNRIAKWDGQSWSSLGSGVNDTVYALAVFDDGLGSSLFVGGKFFEANGVLANRIAKWNGQTWSSVGSGASNGVIGVNPEVRAFAVFHDGQESHLYVGGWFDSAGGISSFNIARWNGSSWSGLGTGTNNGGSINSLVVFNDGNGDALYVGGLFNSVAGITSRNFARWRNGSWSSVNSGISSPVLTMTAFPGEENSILYVGGGFATAGGTTVRFITSWDGQHWSGLYEGDANGISGTVKALAVLGQNLYAAGQFGSVGPIGTPRFAIWNGTSWSAPPVLGPNSDALGLAVFDVADEQAIYVVGAFTQVGGLQVNRVARWDGENWSSLGTGLDGIAYAATVFDDGTGPALYVAGNFGFAGGVPASRIAKWDGQTWSSLGIGVIGTVYALTVFNDGTGPALYATGIFTTAGGGPANRIARWNGQAWSNLGAGLNFDGFSLAVFDDGSGESLYVGGDFTTAGGLPANRIAKWNGHAWTSLGSGTSSRVSALTVFDDGTGAALYAGGLFTQAGGISVNQIARWDGQHWSRLGSGTMNGVVGSVSALATYDDGTGLGLYVGGTFTSSGGVAASNIARWGCRLPTTAGACCIGAACSIRTNLECIQLGGTYRGDESQCGEAGNPSTCCRADFDGDGALAVPDIFAFLSAWFAGSDYADINDDQAVTVPDIFAFLSLWFGGC